MSDKERRIEAAFEAASEVYADLGVDVEEALRRLAGVAVSLHCWQGDDVGGFEAPDSSLSGGGIQATGNYPGRARNADELRQDLSRALSLIPGRHRVNLHAIYGEFDGRKVDRDQVSEEHFRGWVDWAAAAGLKLDMNATFFSHPLAASGFTLSSKDGGVRRFWIEHARRCRGIAAFMGRELGGPAVHNLWIPDGTKDSPADRISHRLLLQQSLDEIYAVEHGDGLMKDALEGKLFGIGSESFVVGSHEFYLSYALTRKKMLCLDAGHFHPTETIADKLSALLPFMDELLLHVSRGVRWDSDHVVIFSDDLIALAQEIVRAEALGRVYLALDYFDAGINRIGAYVIGARSVLKALLYALLEPHRRLVEMEEAGDGCGRLALLDELRGKPFGAVWDAYCLRAGVPVGEAWLEDVRRYEGDILAQRA